MTIRVLLGRARPAVALLLLVLAACRGRPEVSPVAYHIEPWKLGPWEGQKLVTDHYEVYTTVTDPTLVQTFPELIERAYEYYKQLVPPARQPAEPMKVYLLATRAQWAYMTRRLTGPRAEAFLKIHYGGFSEGGVSNIQYVSHPATFPLLAHEGLHQYLHHCVHPAVPAWVNEGLATLCEGQRWTGSGLKEFDPAYNPVRRNQLAEAMLKNRLFPLKKLLSTNAGEVVHETSSRVATYYAQVWMLVLFLQEGEGGKYAPAFRQLRETLGSGELDDRLRVEQIWAEGKAVSPGEALFRSFITDDLDTFEHEYIAFLRARVLDQR